MPQKPQPIPASVTFHEACAVLAPIGYTERSRLLCVLHVERDEGAIRIISARLATAEERKFYEHA